MAFCDECHLPPRLGFSVQISLGSDLQETVLLSQNPESLISLLADSTEVLVYLEVQPTVILQQYGALKFNF